MVNTLSALTNHRVVREGRVVHVLINVDNHKGRRGVYLKENRQEEYE